MPNDLRTQLMRLFRERGYTVGDVLPTEADLMVELGVSRQSLRETLTSLEALGIVVSRQGARRIMGEVSLPAIIRNVGLGFAPDVVNLRKMLEVRRALEAAFFPAVAASFTPQHLEYLRSLTDRMEAKAARGETSLEEDAIFHRALYQNLDNEVLLALIESFWEIFHTTSAVPEKDDLMEIALSHSRIVDALESRDVAMAAHSLNIHFFDIRARLNRSVKAATSTTPTNRTKQ